MPSRKLFQYSETAMHNALKAIREENVPVATACKRFNVPRTSVRNRLVGKTSDDCRRVGPKCVLGEEVEQKLVNWILDCAAKGFPVNREGLLFSVQKIVQECNMEQNFFKDTPGRKWFDSFLRRHPEVSQKHAEFINKARAATSEGRIRRWFHEVLELLGPDRQVLNNPKQIFNMDETAIFLSPKGTLVLGPKGKNIYDIGTSDKDNVTTLIAANAEGDLAPPLTIFKFKRLPKTYASEAPKDWAIGISDSGWMQSKQFYEYFANVFIKFLDKKEIIRPVIVFMDGHTSHLSLNISNLCRSNGIILICLPPNTTHILQPLDVAFFFPLKQAWKKIIRRWLIDHEGRSIQKKDLPVALAGILMQQNFSTAIVSGFRTCGLYPFDENAPDYSRCISKDRLRPSESLTQVTEDSNNSISQLKFLEQQISASVLETFLNCYQKQYFWDGEERFLELYNIWRSVKETVTLPELSSTIPLNMENREEEMLIFDFPEFTTPNQEESYSNEKQIQILDNIVITPAYHIKPPQVQLEILDTLGTSKEDAELSFKIQPNQEKSADECNKETQLFKKRTVSDVLKDVTTWPEENAVTGQEAKKKKITLPSVITSDKWIQIFETKENSKQSESSKKKTKEKLPKEQTKKPTNQTESTKGTKGKSTKESEGKENLTKGFSSKRTSAENLTKENTRKQTEENSFLGIGSFVIVRYDNDLYPAKVLLRDNKEY